MTTAMNLAQFDQLLSARRDSLKPTTTTVRTVLSVISDGWEDVAVGKGDNNTNDSNQNAKTFTQEYLKPDYGWQEMHGFRGDEKWHAPRKVTHCEEEARPGYATKLAHEYEDLPEVMEEKVKVLAALIRASKHCLLYTGAGISTASGISDYATQVSDGTRPRLRSPIEAQPTLAHRVLVEMFHAGHVRKWIQQNHDGLPQKAGFPQHALNEIHGAWYDPSNPVVPMDGSLRTDLYEDMLQWEKFTDLTLSCGTSMCGMNSDRVFTNVAARGRTSYKLEQQQQQPCSAIGGIIIGIQQTQFDHLACLRIFGKLDEVFLMLRRHLQLQSVSNSLSTSNHLSADTSFTVNSSANTILPPELATVDEYYSRTYPFYQIDIPHHLNSQTPDVFHIPYDKKGEKNSKFSTHNTLDLRPDSRVKLVSGPYAGDEGVVSGKNLEGHYRIQFMHALNTSKKSSLRRPFERILGLWWIEAAVKGTLPAIPVVNTTSTYD